MTATTAVTTTKTTTTAATMQNNHHHQQTRKKRKDASTTTPATAPMQPRSPTGSCGAGTLLLFGGYGSRPKQEEVLGNGAFQGCLARSLSFACRTACLEAFRPQVLRRSYHTNRGDKEKRYALLIRLPHNDVVNTQYTPIELTQNHTKPLRDL